ncbi:hypothetical protein BCR43DRAFT_517577 [Syncephalastrum racemosum]|uniref:Uncharacterized protein n=1 Tax=Syncephalastrum racemosum TaxID=13706 RepID=A0A1X2H4S9_SYNRA|nr:hypothetical protein BCR43DRAFT_517577 [Syncephalastrum racemosum]
MTDPNPHYHLNDITRPPQAHVDYHVYNIERVDSPTSNRTSTTRSSERTMVADDTLSTAVTVKPNECNRPSGWLRRRERQARFSRIVFGIIGMIVFLLFLAGVVIWIGNAYILPQVRYTTEYAQDTRTSSSTHATAT